MGVYIPNMEKPKKGEVIAFDGECAVYTDDDMQVHRYPLIEIPTPHGRLIDMDKWVYGERGIKIPVLLEAEE